VQYGENPKLASVVVGLVEHSTFARSKGVGISLAEQRPIASISPTRSSGRAAFFSEAARVSVCFGRTFAVPGDAWKAGVLPNPAVHLMIG